MLHAISLVIRKRKKMNNLCRNSATAAWITRRTIWFCRGAAGFKWPVFECLYIHDITCLFDSFWINIFKAWLQIWKYLSKLNRLKVIHYKVILFYFSFPLHELGFTFISFNTNRNVMFQRGRMCCHWPVSIPVELIRCCFLGLKNTSHVAAPSESLQSMSCTHC